MRRALVLGFCIEMMSAGLSALELAAPFSDGMVLQRDVSVPVWGWADPKEAIVVSCAGQNVKTEADADGRWMVRLSPLKMSKKPLVLEVRGAGGKACVNDILVGEVWLASGQSNMAFDLTRETAFHDRSGLQLAQVTHMPHVRFALSMGPASVEPVSRVPRLIWKRFEPENLLPSRSISAVAFYFARELAIALDVPIGVLIAAEGGSCIDTWTPPCGIATRKDLVDIEKWQYVREKSDWPKDRNRIPFDRWEMQPALFWNGRVEPLAPYAVRGMIWYQGCHNSDEPERYCSKMHALYNGWSAKFQNPELKCYFVQLPFWGRSDTVKMQEAQTRFAMEEPHAGMAVIADCGNLRDIHPEYKEPVGRRLALHALKKDYGFSEIECESPSLATWRTEGSDFVLSFNHAKFFYLRNDNRSKETSFEIAGADGVFRKARLVNDEKEWGPQGKNVPTGVVKGNVLRVRADGVPDPRRLRYLYTPPHSASIYNHVDLPLGAFHVDVTK